VQIGQAALKRAESRHERTPKYGREELLLDGIFPALRKPILTLG